MQKLLFLSALAAFFSHAHAINCYARVAQSSSGGDGGTVSCGDSSAVCYAYTDVAGNQYAGCSPYGCTTYGLTSCVTCSTDLCNTLTTSNLTCYSRSYGNSTNNGTVTTCPPGTVSCYYVASGESNCGSCSSSSSCTTCSSSYCNYQRPFNCYYRMAALSSASMSSVTCYTTCHSFSYMYGPYYWYYNGCGRCNSTLYPNCRLCSTDYCNASVPGARTTWMTLAAALLATVLVVLKIT